MNNVHFKDIGTVVAFWFNTPDVAGSNTTSLQNDFSKSTDHVDSIEFILEKLEWNQIVCEKKNCYFYVRPIGDALRSNLFI